MGRRLILMAHLVNARHCARQFKHAILKSLKQPCEGSTTLQKRNRLREVKYLL